MHTHGFNEHIGYEVVTLNEETCILNFEIKDHHRNIYGYVHGGVYFSLSDIACGLFVRQDKGNWVTLNGNINYLKSAKDQPLIVETKLINKSRKLAVLEVTIRDESTTFAQSTFTMYLID